MGLMQKAYETYEAMANQYMGVYEGQKEPLAPIAHSITAAQIEVTINKAGEFINAVSLDKSEGKIIIPVTEDSASRSGTKAFENPHPLCDSLAFITAEKNYYIPKLEAWATSEYGHPKVTAILTYVKKHTLISDLEKCHLLKYTDNGSIVNLKDTVRWKVNSDRDDDIVECWKDLSLFKAYQDYFFSTERASAKFCMITGKTECVTQKHPKGVVSLYGNAKIVSANDSSGFTYRGRFIEDQQAVSISFEASQKIHSALRWVIANQGIIIGGRTFVCWCPQGEKLGRIDGPMRRGSGKESFKPSDYKDELKNTLRGWKEELPNNTQAVIASFDAATTGRLALTYYSELPASDLLDRLHDWDSSCCWWNGPFGIQSPSIRSIVDYAFGVQRIEKGKERMVTDDKILRQHFQRLFACRVDKMRMPEDIMRALVNRASTPQAYDEIVWRIMVYMACAVIQKYHAPMMKGELFMDWELSKPDRSFQYGRLLAVLERAEEDYYGSTEGSRTTNAIKNLSEFCRRPYSTYERVNQMLLTAYIPRLNSWQKRRYQKLTMEIAEILREFPEKDLNKPLSEIYLMGYDMQRREFFKKSDDNEKNNMNDEEE